MLPFANGMACRRWKYGPTNRVRTVFVDSLVAKLQQIIRKLRILLQLIGKHGPGFHIVIVVRGYEGRCIRANSEIAIGKDVILNGECHTHLPAGVTPPSVYGSAYADGLTPGFHLMNPSRSKRSTNCRLLIFSISAVGMKTETEVNWSCAHVSTR